MSEKSKFEREIDAKVSRMLKARRNANQEIWFGLGTTGVIGWSVAIPSLLGATAGIWLDKRYPSVHSWTLALMFVGLAIGCFSAWQWLDQQDKAINSKEENKNE